MLYAKQAIDTPWKDQRGFSNSFPSKVLRHHLELARREFGL